MVRVMRCGLCTLPMWFRPRCFTMGPTLGVWYHRRMLTTVVAYLNSQGGLCLHRLNRLAQQVLLLAQDRFLSLRVIYIPENMNVGAVLLSRQEVSHRDWKLHPDVLSQIWVRFYESEVDLFASQETAQ